MYEGLKILIIGMATVFAFLVLLIGAMVSVSSYFIKHADRFRDEDIVLEKPSNELEQVAVALAAIKAKRG